MTPPIERPPVTTALVTAYIGQEQALRKKLNVLTSLKVGWDYCDAPPVCDAAAERVLEIWRWFHGLNLKVDVFPDTDGGCSLAFYEGEGKVEVSISPSGEMGLRHEVGIGPDFIEAMEPAENVTLDQVSQAIAQLVQKRWMLFVSSPSSYSTLTSSGSRITYARTPLTVTGVSPQTARAGSRASSSPARAMKGMGTVSVPTLVGSTQS